jgi:hypothetical protein
VSVGKGLLEEGWVGADHEAVFQLLAERNKVCRVRA